MAASEPFTYITESGHAGPQFFDAYHDKLSAKTVNLDIQFVTELRAEYSDFIVTTIPGGNVNLLQFAAAGYAAAELDTDYEPIIRWRGFNPPPHRNATGSLAESRYYAKYRYTWDNEHFILYTIVVGYSPIQYVIKEPRNGETTLSNSSITDELITAIGKWYTADEDVMYVYDGGWRASKALWEQVQKTSWDNVILDPKMKRELTEVSGKFFDNRDVYEDYGVPWKRGLIFHGPVGNGKTISIKALMHTLYNRKSKIPSLYVKSAPQTYNIRSVFAFARTMTPCLLVLEDIETIVTPNTRSYFFNEVDGLENNDGILMIATTNYLNRLDPGLSKRPSRFDRKYLFPLPSLEERVLYCEYWHGKLKDKSRIDFPKSLCRPIASIMDEFSFAYMQEAFVATLLVLARGAESKGLFDEGDAFAYDPYDPEKYEFYRVMKAQIKVLREDMGNTSPPTIVAPRCTTPHASEPVDLEAVARQVEQSALRLGMLSLGGPYSDPLETLLVRSDRSRLLESSDSRRDKQYPGSTAMMSQRLPTRDNGVWEWK